MAEFYDWWIQESELRARLSDRSTTEEFARDSFENLLFGICRFQQVAGRYPRNVTVVGWAFKEARFDLCRAAIRFPAGRFKYDGCNDPIDLKAAWAGETRALRDFIESRYGAGGNPGVKRQQRDPFHRGHPYASGPGLSAFFEFVENPDNGQRDFPGPLPWED